MEGTSRSHQKAYVGYSQIVPKNDSGGKQITSYPYQLRQGDQPGLYQRTSKTSFVDKLTGKYARATNKEAVSGGETFKERSTGRIGHKDEYKTTDTYRVGDKSGYDEYQLEERFRRINFDGSGSKNNKNGRYGSGRGSYQKFGGHGNNVGSCNTYTGGGAVFDSYSSFEDEDHSEEYEESDIDGEESEDYSEESEENDGEEECEESGTEEEVYESDGYGLEEDDDAAEEEYGDYDSLYSDYDDYDDQDYSDYD